MRNNPLPDEAELRAQVRKEIWEAVDNVDYPHEMDRYAIDIIERETRIMHLIQTAIQADRKRLVEALPKPKQVEFLKNNSSVSKNEETLQKFYRYGGYDFALNQVKQLLEGGSDDN